MESEVVELWCETTQECDTILYKYHEQAMILQSEAKISILNATIQELESKLKDKEEQEQSLKLDLNKLQTIQTQVEGENQLLKEKFSQLMLERQTKSETTTSLTHKSTQVNNLGTTTMTIPPDIQKQQETCICEQHDIPEDAMPRLEREPQFESTNPTPEETVVNYDNNSFNNNEDVVPQPIQELSATAQGKRPVRNKRKVYPFGATEAEKIHLDSRRKELCRAQDTQIAGTSSSTARTRTAKNKNHACTWANCGKSFTSYQGLDYHYLTHTGKKPYKCSFHGCEKSFKDTSSEKSHRLTHTQEKNFKCDFPECEKLFAKSSNLKVHQRTHNGEQPFACSICDQRFSLKANRNSHQLIHTGEKPFKCCICNQTFRQNSLKDHSRIHERAKQFFCGVCNKAFNHHSDKSRHEKIHAKKK